MKSNNSRSEIIINITGMHCASCVNRIEKVLNTLDGVKNVSVNLVTQKAFIIGNAPIETLE